LAEPKLSKKQRREKAREERWPKKRRWADAFLQQIESQNPEEIKSDQGRMVPPSGSDNNTEPLLKKRKKKQKAAKALHETLPDMKDHPAIQYLTLWNKNRDNWSFKKSRQNWLLEHLYHRELIDKKRFKILLNYIQALQGKRRQELVDEAFKFITEYESLLSEKKVRDLVSQPTEVDDPEWNSKNAKYKRCRMVFHVLSVK
jgi:hypothetical protein